MKIDYTKEIQKKIQMIKKDEEMQLSSKDGLEHKRSLQKPEKKKELTEKKTPSKSKKLEPLNKFKKLRPQSHLKEPKKLNIIRSVSNKQKFIQMRKPSIRSSEKDNKIWSWSHKEKNKPHPRMPKLKANTFLNQINFQNHREYRNQILQSMEKRICNFRKKIFTGKQLKKKSQVTSKSKSRTNSQTSTKDKVKVLSKKPLVLAQKQFKKPYDEYDYFADKRTQERESAKLSVGKKSQHSQKKSNQSSFKEKTSSQKQPKNKNL